MSSRQRNADSGGVKTGADRTETHSTRQPRAGWKEEFNTIFGFDEESGAPLRIGLFFAVVSVALRLLILYFLQFLVTNRTAWTTKTCPASGSGATEECTPGCAITVVGSPLYNCDVLFYINCVVFTICFSMLMFDLYILARLPVTNRKRLKWMARKTNFRRAFLVCETLCCLIFVSLLVISVCISLSFHANGILYDQPFATGLDYELFVSCLAMISVFVYMFIDWCSVCDLP